MYTGSSGTTVEQLNWKQFGITIYCILKLYVISEADVKENDTSVVYHHLASLISSKHNNPYSRTILFIRSKISFALLHSSLRCLRGSCSTFTTVPSDINIDLALSEGKVTY